MVCLALRTIEDLRILTVRYRLGDREIRIDLLECRFLGQVVYAVEHNPDELFPKERISALVSILAGRHSSYLIRCILQLTVGAPLRIQHKIVRDRTDSRTYVIRSL